MGESRNKNSYRGGEGVLSESRGNSSIKIRRHSGEIFSIFALIPV